MHLLPSSPPQVPSLVWHRMGKGDASLINVWKILILGFTQVQSLADDNQFLSLCLFLNYSKESKDAFSILLRLSIPNADWERVASELLLTL